MTANTGVDRERGNSYTVGGMQISEATLEIILAVYHRTVDGTAI